MIKNNSDKLNKNNENAEIEIVEVENRGGSMIESREDQSVRLGPDGIDVKKGGNFVIGSLNLIGDSIKKRHERHYQENFWHLVADIILVLIIIALIVFSIFSFGVGKDDKVLLKVSTDDQNIIAGQLKTFELEYQIKEDLKENFIKVELPRNFILESVSPSNYYNQEKNTFYLDDLSNGTTGKIKIDGYVIGEKGDHQMISFNFNCNKCGKDGVLSSYFYNINKYLADVSISFPEKIYSNTEVEAKVKIKNNASRDLNHVELFFGDDVEIKKSDLRIEDNRLILEKIDAKQEFEYLVFLNPKNEENINLKPRLSFNFLNDSLYLDLADINKSISKPEIKLGISSNQSLLKTGEKIAYKFEYENQNSQAIKDISFRLNSGQLGLFLSSVEILNAPNNVSLENNIIKIEDLVPGEKQKLELLVLFERRQILSNQEALLVADVEYQINNQNVKYTAYSSRTKMVSDVLTNVSGRYYSEQGDQLGVGPLPPAVGMATNYWLFLEFNNSGNKLKDFVLTAELPDNVYFSGNKRVLDGSLNYAEIGKRVIWEISEIEGGINKYRANLEIIFIPEQEDLGKVVDLVKNIKFTVYDEFTQGDISQSLENINTNLKGDRFSSDKGRVVIIK
ncbi:MAG: hypothetical protein WCY43_00520 [Patescibacteria group bacterium]|nr:hypothetical protein [Patescibacteria group bacterium]